MRGSLVVVGLLVASSFAIGAIGAIGATVAAADGGKAKGKAQPRLASHVECYLHAPGEERPDAFPAAKRIKSKKKVVIAHGTDVACRLVLDGVAPPAGGKVQFALIQDKQVLDVFQVTDAVIPDDGGPAYYALPTTLVRGQSFRGCAPFRFTASLQSPEAYASGEVTVVQACPKPKKEKAAIRCYSQVPGGELLEWPGNGSKAPRELLDPVECEVLLKKVKGDAARYLVTLTTGIGDSPPPPAALQPADVGWYASFSLSPDDEFDTCETFTVKARIADPDDRTVWTGSMKLAQQCAR